MKFEDLKESDKERMSIEPGAYLASVWKVSTRRIEIWRRELGILSPKELFRGMNKQERLKA